MIHFKKYIVLDCNGKCNKYSNFDSFSIKIKTGILSNHLKDQLSVNKWTHAINDRLYFFPGCSVPRFKIKDKYNVTIKPEYATAAFISANDLKASDNMFNVINNVMMLDGNSIQEWFAFLYGPQHHLTIKLKSLLLNCENEILADNNLYYQLLFRSPQDALYSESLHHFIKDRYGDCRYGIESKDVVNFYHPTYNSNLTKLTCPIYLQDDILSTINDNQLVIDEKKYQELRLILNSPDKDNIILAMELMSNADYKKSFVYLLLLFKEFNSKIENQKKEIGHVNFKSLLTYLDLNSKTMDMSIESFMSKLKSHKQFTRKNVQYLTQFYRGTCNTDHFTTGAILNPTYESILDDDSILLTEDTIQVDESENDNFNL